MTRISSNAAASSSSTVASTTLDATATTQAASKTRKPKSTSSKLRMHKGNTPVLPQTKQCTLCNAKFTRTTHLTRHLRSHSNERLYSCDLCNAEFTRSDLLTRHQRSCGDPNAGRSRRTSCESCAKSKIKCDLEQPCSKCVNRGRECVYLNDPNASKEKTKQPNSQEPTSPADTPSDSQASPTSPIINVNGVFSMDSRHSEDSLTLPSLVEDTGSVSPSSFQASLSPQPQPIVEHTLLDNFEIVDSTAAPLGFQYDMSYLGIGLPSEPAACADTQYDYLPTNMDPDRAVELSMAQFNAMVGTTSSPLSGLMAPRMHANLASLHRQQHLDVFGPMMSSSPLTVSSSFPSPATFTPHLQFQEPDIFGSIWSPVEAKSPLDTSLTVCQEKNRYFGLFFSAYLENYPFLHRATWTATGKPWILLKAMQACGAMYASDDSGGTRFVRDTLGYMKDIVVWEFARTTDSMERDNIIVATGLLLTICAFDQVHDEFFRTYQDALVSMIREAGVVERVGRGWDAMSLAIREIRDGQTEELDRMWIAWSHYETMKRILLIAYISDCSLPPSFHPDEFSINMACEPSLFGAISSSEWYDRVLKAPLSGPKANGPGGLGANVQMAVKMLNVEGVPGAVPGVPADSEVLESVKEMSPCSRGVLARTIQILVWVGKTSMGMGVEVRAEKSASALSYAHTDFRELEHMFAEASGMAF